MSHEKLVYMANQIATAFAALPEDQALQSTVEHINDFWEPRMRRQLLDLVEQGNSGLSPLALKAAGLIRRPETA